VINSHKYLAEFIGTVFLLATVIGFGVMGETLADGNMAVALLGNTIAIGAILFVLITILGPMSGAHFNPVVTIARTLSNTFAGINPANAPLFMISQLIGMVVALAIAKVLFMPQR
tara:strand:+ start:55888 stop:56232 length:345 start_codon:yes stop_codon:yes gene_type:complete